MVVQKKLKKVSIKIGFSLIYSSTRSNKALWKNFKCECRRTSLLFTKPASSTEFTSQKSHVYFPYSYFTKFMLLCRKFECLPKYTLKQNTQYERCFGWNITSILLRTYAFISQGFGSLRTVPGISSIKHELFSNSKTGFPCFIRGLCPMATKRKHSSNNELHARASATFS